MKDIQGNRPITAIAVAKYVLLFIPAFIYFYYVNKNAVNLPWQDDYDAVLQFLIQFKAAAWSDKAAMLFLQHNEHRILSSRIVYVLYYSILGNINFRHLIFIADAQVVLTFLIVLSFIKKLLPGNWFLAALVLSICLFDINNWENANFAMAGMQNYGVIFLCCLSLWLYSSNKKGCIPFAVLCQAICMFSSGNGIVASAFVAAYAILSKDRLRAVCATLTFLISGPLYFLHYHNPTTGHPATDVRKVGAYFLDLFSGHVVVNNDVLQLIIGAVLAVAFACFLPITKKLKIKEDALPLVCIAGFLVASMLVTSIFRCNVAGVPPNSSRYLVYPNFIAALLFVFVVYRMQGKAYRPLVTIPFAALLLVVYNMNVHHNKLVFDNMKVVLNTNTYYYPDATRAKRIATEACAQNIYCIEQHRQGK